MEKENAMDEDKNMKTITVTDNDVVGSDTRLVDVIAALQDALAKIPEEFRDVAELEIWAYDWEGSCVTYSRPLTNDEQAERLAGIERQRLHADKNMNDEWLRNVRIATGLTDRALALEFIQNNPDANQYHPDIYTRQ
jgi:hypothetical protein